MGLPLPNRSDWALPLLDTNRAAISGPQERGQQSSFHRIPRSRKHRVLMAGRYLSDRKKHMPKITGKDGVIFLSESHVKVQFDRGMARDRLAASPRDIPLTSISAIELGLRSGWTPGFLRLSWVGDSAPPRSPAVDINTVLMPFCGERNAVWETFAETLRDAVIEAVPKVPLNEQPLTVRTPDIRIDASTYLGGLPGTEPQRYPSILIVNGTRIGTGDDCQADFGCVDWVDCEGVSIGGRDIAKSRVAATRLFVVVGLAMKGATANVLVTARKRDGTAALFQITEVQVQVVTAALQPLLRKLGIQIRGVSPALLAPTAPGEPSPIEPLERIGKLRDAGVLIDEEFAAKKAELLGRM